MEVKDSVLTSFGSVEWRNNTFVSVRRQTFGSAVTPAPDTFGPIQLLSMFGRSWDQYVA